MHATNKQHCNLILIPLSNFNNYVINVYQTVSTFKQYLTTICIFISFRMPFYLQSSNFRSRVIPFLEMVQKDISTWINKPMQFKTMESYLDIISILNVYGDQHTITLPINIAKDNIHVTLHVTFHETSATLQFHIELDKSWIIPKRLIPQPQIIPLCNPITSPALLRRLKHYKGRQQFEFLQLTSLLAKFPGCESRNHMWKITTYMVKEPHTAHTDYLNTENWNVCLHVKKCLKRIPCNVYEKHYLMVDNILWKEFNMKEVSIKSGAA